MKFVLILFLSFFSWFIPVRPSTNAPQLHYYHSEIPTGENLENNIDKYIIGLLAELENRIKN
jgi:hypothetical protein